MNAEILSIKDAAKTGKQSRLLQEAGILIE